MVFISLTKGSSLHWIWRGGVQNQIYLTFKFNYSTWREMRPGENILGILCLIPDSSLDYQ